MSDEITKSQLEEVFSVDRENGRLFWRKHSKYHPETAGQEAGGPIPNRSGKLYWVIRLNGRKRKRSHLMFCLTHDRLPSLQIDHINGNSLDDRPTNLREATATQNAWNHKKRKRRIALPMGVRVVGSGRFEARIGFHKKQIHLGAFDTPEAAQVVYAAKRKELYGEFA